MTVTLTNKIINIYIYKKNRYTYIHVIILAFLWHISRPKLRVISYLWICVFTMVYLLLCMQLSDQSLRIDTFCMSEAVMRLIAGIFCYENVAAMQLMHATFENWVDHLCILYVRLQMPVN